MSTNLNLQAVDAVVARAVLAFDRWKLASAQSRADFLNELAHGLEWSRDPLVDIAMTETSLGKDRLGGELTRTVFQLKHFADKVLAGRLSADVENEVVAGPPPAGHPHLLRTHVPVGVVAVFAASNFPFAFSVLGGDTVSALAVGCPVVVKVHPGHPRLSRAVQAIAQGVMDSRPEWEGLVGLVEGAGFESGVHLVEHPQVAAVSFTGSLAGGRALWKIANAREVPIPFYGELGSINPVVVLPSALEQGGGERAAALAASIAGSSGQFCTSPGVLIGLKGPAMDTFVQSLAAGLSQQATHRMLTEGIERSFAAGVERLGRLTERGVSPVPVLDPSGVPKPGLFVTDAQRFVDSHELREEVFGPSCVVVLADSPAQIAEVLLSVTGSLTVTLWGLHGDDPAHHRILDAALRIGGRILFDGVPTGVAVTESQHHGGPWPSSTNALFTSVGDASSARFLRPVVLQSFPAWARARVR
ncbi:aldehyde dehydrogenase family protein [Rhizobacter sp. Root1221]|uniref:aldehyde dehydrogenase family protein n=1 Tax=Rhizobacter sp. Root1221 TaxID=1736433 RepID=UPI000700114E|nr:aldehyde dehydrogenase family protein [Rhizobacter sp. Root1221]KQV92813.1 hypothetical protein ASC87_27495 [Rhizobacter sp. Root1221]